MSNGYVARVAAVPANAPEQNATADGLVLRFCMVSIACCAGRSNGGGIV